MTTQTLQTAAIRTQLAELGLADILSVEEVLRYIQAFGCPRVSQLQLQTGPNTKAA